MDALLTKRQVYDARRQRAQGMTLRGLAKQYGVSHQTLGNYLRRADGRPYKNLTTIERLRESARELLADGCKAAVILANFPELTEADLR